MRLRSTLTTLGVAALLTVAVPTSAHAATTFQVESVTLDSPGSSRTVTVDYTCRCDEGDRLDIASSRGPGAVGEPRLPPPATAPNRRDP